MNATLYMLPLEKLAVVKEADTIENTLKMMKDGSYKTLPVVDQANHFVGVIREGKLYESYFYNSVQKDDYLHAEIRPLVDRNIKAISKDTDFLHVILEMEKMDIHFLPVEDQNHRFMGIVTRNKIFEAFESAFGYNQDGYLIDVVAIDAKGQLARLAGAIAGANANIASMIHFDMSVANLERVIIKVQTDNIDHVLEHIADHGFRINSHRFVPKQER